MSPPFQRHVFVCTNRRPDGHLTGAVQSIRTKTIKKLGLNDEEKAALVKLLESMTGTP